MPLEFVQIQSLYSSLTVIFPLENLNKYFESNVLLFRFRD